MDIGKNYDKLRHIVALDNAKNMVEDFNKLHGGKKFKPENVKVTPHYYTSVDQTVVPFLCSGDTLYLSRPTIIELSENLYNMEVNEVLKDIDRIISNKESVDTSDDYGRIVTILPVEEYLDAAEGHLAYVVTLTHSLKAQFPTVNFEVNSELHVNENNNHIIPFRMEGDEVNNTPNTIRPTKVSISIQSIYLIWNNTTHVTKQSLNGFTETCMNQVYRILNTGIVEPVLSIHSLESHVANREA